MHRSLAQELETSGLGNVRLSSFRLPSVWGAANLYEVSAAPAGPLTSRKSTPIARYTSEGWRTLRTGLGITLSTSAELTFRLCKGREQRLCCVNPDY